MIRGIYYTIPDAHGMSTAFLHRFRVEHFANIYYTTLSARSAAMAYPLGIESGHRLRLWTLARWHSRYHTCILVYSMGRYVSHTALKFGTVASLSRAVLKSGSAPLPISHLVCRYIGSFSLWGGVSVARHWGLARQRSRYHSWYIGILSPSPSEAVY